MDDYPYCVPYPQAVSIRLGDWFDKNFSNLYDEADLESFLSERDARKVYERGDSLKARFNWNEIHGLEVADDVADYAHRAKRNKLVEAFIELHAFWNIGRWLLKRGPKKRGPKAKDNSPEVRGNSDDPGWLRPFTGKKGQKLSVLKRIGAIPPEHWFAWLMEHLESGDASVNLAEKEGDEYVAKKHREQDAQDQEEANREFFEKPKAKNRKANARYGKTDNEDNETAYAKVCRIYQGDFLNLEMTGPPVRRGEKPVAIITDPPYKDEWFEPEKDASGRILWSGKSLWQRFAEWSQDNLAKNGDLVVMVGTQWLDRAMTTILTAGWQYRWTIAVKYNWFRFNHGRKVQPLWKPVLVFNRKGEQSQGGIAPDWFKAGKRVKDHGEWQQDVETFERLVKYFAKPKALVCDPFTGYGTTAVASIRKARRFVGAEIKSDRWKIADRVAKTEFRKQVKAQADARSRVSGKK
jgi:hypothetical protein